MPGIQVPTGVGRTAIMVSWIRAAEGRRPDALFHDPFAEHVLVELTDAPETADMIAALSDGTAPLIEQLSSARFSFIPVRTRYFDDHLLAAMHAGIRQVVSLGSGLDGRTVRLSCPPDTHWYEVDLPMMTALKDALLIRSELTPTCTRHSVAADVTSDDWITELREAGFDPTFPTAWLIEGLLMYVTAEAGEQLLATVTENSVPTSKLLLEHLSTNSIASPDTPLRDVVESQGTEWLSAHDGLAPWLAGYGWRAEVHANNDARISHGRAIPGIASTWLWMAHATLPRDQPRILRATTIVGDDVLHSSIDSDTGGSRTVEQRTSKDPIQARTGNATHDETRHDQSARYGAWVREEVGEGGEQCELGSDHAGSERRGLDLGMTPGQCHTEVDANGDAAGVEIVLNRNHNGRAEFVGYDTNYALTGENHDGQPDSCRVSDNGDDWLDRRVVSEPRQNIRYGIDQQGKGLAATEHPERPRGGPRTIGVTHTGPICSLVPSTIVVRDLHKTYGDVRAVAGISFEVPAGEFFGILGPSGAGKTTTLEIIEGLRQADSGEVRVFDMPPWPRNPRLLARIGVQLQASSFFERLTVREQIRTFASLYGEAPDKADHMLDVVGLSDKADTRGEKLSGGQAQRLSIACALVHEPELLFLDEPSAALDPQARRNLWDLLRSLNTQGRTIVLTTHYMDEAEALCDRVAIMDEGKILELGPPAVLVRGLDAPTRISIESGLLPVDEARNLSPGSTMNDDGVSLTIATKEPAPVLAALAERRALRGLSVRGATLEDVFLNLTGREYRA